MASARARPHSARPHGPKNECQNTYATKSATNAFFPMHIYIQYAKQNAKYTSGKQKFTLVSLLTKHSEVSGGSN